jgi:hypothetical protein
MSTGRFLAALLAVLPALSVADVSVPDTPAGHALGAWLDAFNSADRTDDDDTAQTNVFFRVKARTSGGEEIGRFGSDSRHRGLALC